LEQGEENRKALFVAEVDHRIHAHGAASGYVSGDGGYSGEHNWDGSERRRVAG
jgi:hypothetical protein